MAGKRGPSDAPVAPRMFRDIHHLDQMQLLKAGDVLDSRQSLITRLNEMCEVACKKSTFLMKRNGLDRSFVAICGSVENQRGPKSKAQNDFVPPEQRRPKEGSEHGTPVADKGDVAQTDEAKKGMKSLEVGKDWIAHKEMVKSGERCGFCVVAARLTRGTGSRGSLLKGGVARCLLEESSGEEDEEQPVGEPRDGTLPEQSAHEDDQSEDAEAFLNTMSQVHDTDGASPVVQQRKKSTSAGSGRTDLFRTRDRGPADGSEKIEPGTAGRFLVIKTVVHSAHCKMEAGKAGRFLMTAYSSAQLAQAISAWYSEQCAHGSKPSRPSIAAELNRFTRATVMPTHNLVYNVSSVLEKRYAASLGGRMETLQGLMSANIGLGHKGYLLVTDGNGVRLRLWSIAERRWEQWQRKVNPNPRDRQTFDKRKVLLPEIVYLKRDGTQEKIYLIGWMFIPSWLMNTFEHWQKVISKDMCHCRKAAGAVKGVG